MNDKPIGWTSGESPSGYRFPEPVRNWIPPFEEVVDCGGVLIRRERPKPREAALDDPQALKEDAHAYLDPMQRGELIRKMIREKYDSLKRER